MSTPPAWLAYLQSNPTAYKDFREWCSKRLHDARQAALTAPTWEATLAARALAEDRAEWIRFDHHHPPAAEDAPDAGRHRDHFRTT